MAQILDLSTFKQENIEITATTGEKYIIPGNSITTDFVITFQKLAQDIGKAEKAQDYKKSLEILKEGVLSILKLDPTKQDITLDTLREQQFNSVPMLMAVLNFMSEAIKNISSSPLSQSPKSE